MIDQLERFRRDQPLLVGPPPRVALLPPEVGEARAWRRTTRIIAAAAVASVFVSAALAGQAFLASMESAAQLSAAQTRTETLLAKVQGYTSVTQTQARITTAKAAQASVTDHWIDWRGVLQRVQKALPAGACLTGFTAAVAGGAATTTTATTATGSTTAATAPSGTVATITLGAATQKLSGVQAWIADLAHVPGYLEADPSSVASDGEGALKVGMSLYLGSGVYSARSSASRVVPTTTAASSTEETGSLPASCTSSTSSSTSTGSTASASTTAAEPTATATPAATSAATSAPVVVAVPVPTVTVTVSPTVRPAADPKPSTAIGSRHRAALPAPTTGAGG